jgi:nucleoside-diphosphate-sugar epimerase
MKIAITGGEGFIGNRLASQFEADGHSIVSIDLKSAQPVDLLNVEALTAALSGCGAIYHLAAEHRDDVTPRSRYYDVNVQGMSNLLAAADANNIKRIVFTSSFAVYGLNSGMPDENGAKQPFNDYGKSKLEAEGVLLEWAKSSPHAQVTIVRPVVVFGEGNRGNVYTFIDQIARGKFLMVGDGRNRKSMAYVGNVVGFLKHLLPDTSHLEIYNYADKPDFSMNDLVKVIYKKMGKARPGFSLPYSVGLTAGYAFDALAFVTRRKFPISAVRIQKFCADTTCNADKVRKSGFAPDYTLDQGVERMIDHDFPSAKQV